ncbi:MAG: purine-nucleoside phosphorylase [Planctomycetaceae bacterium]|nr:MAG: purine-nucleoside phosphorylase [Planctomycetaceae bacterium]
MDRPDRRSDLLASALSTLRSVSAVTPRVGIILGSGLGTLADEIPDPVRVDFRDLPGFGLSTATGHRGQCVLGRLDDVPVVAFSGRLHRYEGYPDDQITFPVRVMAAWGVRQLIVSNAAGGLNPLLRVGDLVVIRDQIDLGKRRQPRQPGHWDRSSTSGTDSAAESGWAGETLRGIPSPAQIYDTDLAEIALRAARNGDFRAWPGIYLSTLGPTYETRAEYRMMRRLGADVVGMSTAPEALTAASLGMRVLGVSVVSNVAIPERGWSEPLQPTLHQDVLDIGKGATEKLRHLVFAVLRQEIV